MEAILFDFFLFPCNVGILIYRYNHELYDLNY